MILFLQKSTIEKGTWAVVTYILEVLADIYELVAVLAEVAMENID